MASRSSEGHFFSFQSKDFLTNFAPVFQEMRNSGKLCDVEIRVKNRSISAHKVILAAAIPYFYKMFRADNQNCKKQMEIVMEEFDPVAIETLIEFCYSGKLKIESKNVENLMILTNLFEMDEIWDACVNFLKSNLNSNNVIRFKRLGESKKCKSLIKIADQFISENFSQIIMSDDFVKLTFEEFSGIVVNGNLEVSPAEKVFEATMKWIKHSEGKRAKNLPEILTNINLSRLSSEFLVNIISKEKLIRGSIACLDMLDEAKTCHLISKTKELTLISNKKAQPTTQNLKEMIYVFVGRDVKPKNPMRVSIYVYNESKWSKNKCLAVEIEDIHVAHAKGKIYVIGNYVGFQRPDPKFVAAYDYQRNEWSDVARFEKDRTCFAAVALSDHIYVCGGRSNSPFGCTKSVERFSIAKKKWKSVSSMKKARVLHRAITLNGCIYVLGNPMEKTCEKYCPKRNKWSFISSMQEVRWEFGAAALNGKLYVCGGQWAIFKSSALNSCEVYDPELNSWSFIAPMKVCREDFALISCNGKLYAIGGSNGNYNLESVEEYCPERNEWKFVAPLPNDACGLKAVAVPNL